MDGRIEIETRTLDPEIPLLKEDTVTAELIKWPHRSRPNCLSPKLMQLCGN